MCHDVLLHISMDLVNLTAFFFFKINYAGNIFNLGRCVYQLQLVTNYSSGDCTKGFAFLNEKKASKTIKTVCESTVSSIFSNLQYVNIKMLNELLQ